MNKLFGIFRKYKYPYSDKERTIIDALEYSKYLGGLSEVLDRVKDSKYDKNKLIDYAIKYGSIKIMKLVGLLTDSSKIFNLLKKKDKTKIEKLYLKVFMRNGLIKMR